MSAVIWIVEGWRAQADGKGACHQLKGLEDQVAIVQEAMKVVASCSQEK